jgi:hypothetical protein
MRRGRGGGIRTHDLLHPMETEGALFNAQLKNPPYKELRASVQKLSWAQRQLGARIDEKLADA